MTRLGFINLAKFVNCVKLIFYDIWKFCKHKDIISTCNPNARFLKFTFNIKTYEKFEGFLSKLVLRKIFVKKQLILYFKKKIKKTRIIDNWFSIFYIFVNMNNTKDINYFTNKFINYWCGNWLLINEKLILMVGLDVGSS